MKKKLSILLASLLAMMLLFTAITGSAAASDQPDNTDIKYVKFVKCRVYMNNGESESSYYVEPNIAHRKEINSKDIKARGENSLSAKFGEPNYQIIKNGDDRGENNPSRPDNQKNSNTDSNQNSLNIAPTTDSEIARYQVQYAKLKAKFEYMFQLKNIIEQEQSTISDKWNEYYALHNIYNKELEKLAKDFAINL